MRARQYLVANGIAVLQVNPSASETWDWYGQSTWDEGYDKFVLSTSYRFGSALFSLAAPLLPLPFWYLAALRTSYCTVPAKLNAVRSLMLLHACTLARHHLHHLHRLHRLHRLHLQALLQDLVSRHKERDGKWKLSPWQPMQCARGH